MGSDMLFDAVSYVVSLIIAAPVPHVVVDSARLLPDEWSETAVIATIGSTIASAAVAIYTAVLAKQTRALAQSTVETARISRDAVAPSIDLEHLVLQFDGQPSDLQSRLQLTAAIRNLGNGPALGVTLSVKLTNSTISVDRYLGSLVAQEKRASLMYPFNIGNAGAVPGIALFPAATVVVTYSAISGNKRRTEYELEAANTDGDHVIKATLLG